MCWLCDRHLPARRNVVCRARTTRAVAQRGRVIWAGQVGRLAGSDGRQGREAGRVVGRAGPGGEAARVGWRAG